MSADQTIVYRKRRNVELVGVLIAALFGVGGFMLTHLNRDGELPAQAWTISVIWLVICLAAHFAVRWRAPYADPTLLPIVLALNGLGLAMIHRLDISQQTALAHGQLIWSALGVALFFAALWLVRDYREIGRAHV